jgi:hypothetical protein
LQSLPYSTCETPALQINIVLRTLYLTSFAPYCMMFY